MFRRLTLLVLIALAAMPFALAQQRQGPSSSAGPPVPPPAPPPRSGITPPSQSAWVRLCETPRSIGRDSFGKGWQVGTKTCLTFHERIDGTNALVLFAVGVRDVEGQQRRQFTIMVPPGMQQQPGIRANFYPRDLWQRVQDKQRIDKSEEARIKSLPLGYAFCHAGGCTAEIEATPELIADLTTSAGLIVFAIAPNGQPQAFAVPLNGFREAHLGTPTDSVAFHRARSQLLQRIRDRQRPMDRTGR